MGELARHIVAVTDNEGAFRRSLPPLLLRPVSRRLRPGRIQVLHVLGPECAVRIRAQNVVEDRFLLLSEPRALITG